MRKTRISCQLIIGLLLLGATTQIFGFQSVTATDNSQGTLAYISTEFTSEMLGSPALVPTIVEFHKLPSAVYDTRLRAAGVVLTGQELAAYVSSIRTEHQQFLNSLTSQGIPYVVTGDTVVVNEREQKYLTHEFDYIYNGLGLQVPGTAIHTIARMPEISAIFPNLPKQYVLLDTSVEWIQAKRVWSQLGAKGEGMRIAVIDTGIDWTHPAFGGFLTVPNQKVIFAMTFTAGTVMDDFGHGTHVSGIAAGDSYKNTPRGDSLIEGVAPKALLMSYKVLTASGSGLSASVVQAINDAAQNNAAHQKAHVINLSLGSTSGDPESADARAVNNAAEAGVVPAVSAGNSGPGESTIGSPGSAKNALTVGANNDNNVGYFFVKVTSPPGQRQDIQAQMFSNSLRFPINPPINTNYVFCGLAATPVDCPLTVQGKIALIERGTATFTLKGRNAELAGARAAIIYNNVPGPFTGFMEPGIGIPVAAISREDGLYLRGLGADPTGVSLAIILLDPNGIFAIDQITGFSSRGPNDDLRIKPNVLAPGVDTFSATVLVSAPVVAMGNPEGYTEASGTSMAAPHVAGAAALLRQVHPDWNAFDVRAALMNTGIRVYDLNGNLLRVMDQGAGRVDVFEAATAKALLTDTTFKDGAFSFGLVTHQFAIVTRTVQFNLKSATTSTVTYTLSHEFTTATSGMSGSFSQSSITLAPSTTATFSFTWTIDGRVVPDGDHDGWIFLSATDGSEALHAPLWARLETLRTNLTPPVLDDPGEFDNDGTYTLTWGTPSFSQHLSHYRLQEATTLATVFEDNADLIVRNWNPQTTWTQSGARFHSSMFSFFSGQGPNLNSILTLANAIQLPSGGITLSWWSFEDTEPGFDFIHVDASRDGSSWTNLFRTSGTCGEADPFCPEDFQLRSVDLSAYAGGPVFIRFRYTTDLLIDAGLFEGWYIDDIEITSANWQDIGQPAGRSFTVQGRPEGTYFYRVAAVYTNQEQGPYSNVVDMTVQHGMPVTSVLLRATGDPKKDAVKVTYFSGTGNAKLVIENFNLRELKVTINGQDIGSLSNELNRNPTGTIEVDVSQFINPGENTIVFVPGGKRGQATVTIMDT